MLRLSLFFLAFLLAAPLRAHTIEDHTNGFAIAVPDAGWEPVAPPEVPGIKVLMIAQNSSRGALVGVNLLTGAPTANLRDPATIKFVEDMLRSFKYELFGSASTTVSGIEWKQFPVRSSAGGQITSGVVRFTSYQGKIYGLTLQLMGGKEAAQDPELQGIGRSFRFIPIVAEPAPTPPPPVVEPPKPTPEPKVAEVKPTPAPKPAAEPAGLDPVRIGMFVAGGIVVLLVVIKLLSGGGGGGAKPRPRTMRRG